MNEVRRERRWINEHRGDPKVREWIRDHPPPPEWEGSAMQWAYTEMPQGGKMTAVVIGVGLLGLTGLAMWLINRPKRQPLVAGPPQAAPLTRVPRCREGEVLDRRTMTCVPIPPRRRA